METTYALISDESSLSQAINSLPFHSLYLACWWFSAFYLAHQIDMFGPSHISVSITLRALFGSREMQVCSWNAILMHPISFLPCLSHHPIISSPVASLIFICQDPTNLAPGMLSRTFPGCAVEPNKDGPSGPPWMTTDPMGHPWPCPSAGLA